jgi:two-component system NtrC family sensor kinase
MIWFLVLSLAPLMFVTGYSLVKYEQAIDNELVQRLRANSREFVSTIEAYEKYLTARRTRLRADPMLSYYLLTNSVSQAKKEIESSVRNDLLSSASLFNRDGQLIASITQDGKSSDDKAIEDGSIYLSDSYREILGREGQITTAESGGGNSVDLIAITRIDTKNGRVAGYVEEIINIGPAFLQNLKGRLNLEIMLFDSKGNLSAGSHPDFLLYSKDYFSKFIAGEKEAFFDLTVRSEPFGFITTPVNWGNSTFLVGLGASKQKAKGILKNVNYAFFTMICAIGLILVLISVFATRVIVGPVYEIIAAIQQMDVRDGPVEIPVTTDTELGVLTDSFNEMSRRIYQTKMELEKKIKELELAYKELKETQARLLHTGKMASLGQMVAGIAHELNNPIGFIYSNMSHLKDYTQRLNSIIDAAGNGDAVEAAKAKADYPYVLEDLPRLITSCEEGARRTRDIVLGLRNFSRLEEAKIKRVSLQEGIENTLRLLSGEIKNRLRVHTEFGNVPPVLCYASQLNQVFMNILTNASQALEGEGDIWITLKETRQGVEPWAQISIKDSGKGMPTEVVEKIFDPFYTTKGVGQGTGLGLSISYGIVKQHGGEIRVKSAVGKGTEFVITVPVKGPPGAKDSAESAS